MSPNEVEHKYKLPRQQRRAHQIPKALNNRNFVWLRLDRVKRPLEAPYQGPFCVIERHHNTFTIEIKGKSVVVSIQRLKPAVLPTAQQTHNQDSTADPEVKEETQPTTTRTWRTVRFKKNDDVAYFFMLLRNLRAETCSVLFLYSHNMHLFPWRQFKILFMFYKFCIIMFHFAYVVRGVGIYIVLQIILHIFIVFIFLYL